MQVSPVLQPLPLQPAGTGEKQGDGGGNFSAVLDKALQELNGIQARADSLALGLLTGEIEDIHQVTIAMQEARLAMQLAVEVRNKVVEAYQEVSRMQV